MIKRAKIIVLLADGFDEAAIGVILTTLREAGLAVKLVGLRAGAVRGSHGMAIVTDSSLDKLLNSTWPILALILPTGPAHLDRLQSDPRVRALLQCLVADKTQLIGLGEDVADLVEQVIKPNGQPKALTIPTINSSLEDFSDKVVQQFNMVLSPVL